MDPFGTGQVLPPLQVPQPTVQHTVVPPLKKPPKWVRRPVGASFAVSARLKTFYNHRNRKGFAKIPQPYSFTADLLLSCVSVWWEADNLWESQDTSSAEPPAHPQTSVCEPGHHRDRVPPTLQGAAGGAAVRFLQQLLSGQDSKRQVRRWAGHMEVPSGGPSCPLDMEKQY